jgi:uncharacterized protein (DUF1800 family)
MNTKEIQHLFWRAGFGISPDEIQHLQPLSKRAIVDQLISDSMKVTPLYVNTSELNRFDQQKVSSDQKTRQDFQKKSRLKIKELNVAWIDRLSKPDAILRERMTLFWANHFACKDVHIFHIQKYNNTLRKHALGNLKDFVKAISKEPSMLKYLNNKQNVKERPNENFSRELMELFTLGKGNYSETDIKESARAFSGYFHGHDGRFFLRQRKHDYGIKRFLGKRGRFDGDDIINIIFSKKQCARFICEKIYSYFVNDIINDDHIESMISVFYPRYNIKDLMKFIFLSDWFYDKQNIGVKIKSPIDFLVGVNNVVPIRYKDPKQLLSIQKILGQELLYPPNVSGWKGGKAWIDSNTIMLRLRLPALLLNDGPVSIKKKGEFIDKLSEFINNNKTKRFFKVESDWASFKKKYNQVSIEDLKDYLILSEINKGTASFLEDLGKVSKKEYCIQLMSLPEYQMC